MLENLKLPLPASQQAAENVLANILAADPDKINDELSSSFYQFIVDLFHGEFTEEKDRDINDVLADVEDTLSTMDCVLGEAFSIKHSVLEDPYLPKLEIEICLGNELLLHMVMDPLLAQVMTKKRLREIRSTRKRK